MNDWKCSRTWSLLLAAPQLLAFLPLPEVCQPQVAHPQDAHRYPGADHHRPRRPRPRRHAAASAVGLVEEPHHPHEPRRAERGPRGRVRRVERRRQRGVHPGGQRRVEAPHARQRPHVLRGAGGLREHLERQQRARAGPRGVAAGGQDVERGEVVRDEEGLAGEEEEVVRQVHGEVGRAEVEDQVVGGRVGRRQERWEAAAGGAMAGQHGAEGEQRRGGAVEERGEAAGGLGAVPRSPAAEDDEEADEVDGREHRQERQEHGLRARARRGGDGVHLHANRPRAQVLVRAAGSRGEDDPRRRRWQIATTSSIAMVEERLDAACLWNWEAGRG
jgi:hypothetical protein